MTSTIPDDRSFSSNHDRTVQPAALDPNRSQPFPMISATTENESSLRICRLCKTGDKRRLVVCIDGTDKQFCLKNSNVVEIYKHVVKSDQQLTYYNSGIGTYVRRRFPKAAVEDFIDNTIDQMIAWHVKRHILDAYTWISDNYTHGDQIWLFGFSRGAYQIRALAGMIETVGIIHRGNRQQIPFAYELYSSHRGNKKSDENLARHFKETFSRPAKLHFVGVWDTVSSVGVFRRKKLPLTKESDHICYVRHALALDECRIKYRPEYVKPPRNFSDVDPRSNQNDEVDQTNSATSDGITSEVLSQERVKEVWFAGSHSDIGGGLLRNPEANLGDVPVLWMANQAMLAGLQLHYQNKGWDLQKIREQRPTNSMGLKWLIFEVLPLRRLQPGSTRSKTIRRFRLNLCRGRVVLDGQKIHASFALKPHTYRPAASGINWSDLRPRPEVFNPGQADINGWLRYTSSLDSDRWDKDVYDFSVTLIFWCDQIQSGVEGAFHALRTVLPDPTMILGQEIARISPEKIVASIVEFMRSLDPTRRELLQQAANYLLPLLRDKKTSHLAIPALNITIETLEGFSKGLLLTSLGDSLLRRYDRFSELEDLDKAILELEQAMSLVPPGRPGFLLGTCYYHRFRRLNQSQDIHHSISKFEDALKSVPHDSMLLMNAGLALFARYEIEECHDDINQSVKNYEEAIEHTPDTDHRKPVLLYNLSDALHRRFQDMEDSTDINQAIKILDRAIELTKDSSQRATFLGQLGKVYCTRFQKRNDPLDIMISISKFEQGLQISRNDNVCRALLLNLFGSALLVQFQQDRSNVSAIDKAFQNIVESIRITDEGEPIRRARLQNLAAVVTEAVCHDLSFRFGKKLDTLISGLENLLQVEPNDQLLLKDAGMSLFARFRVRGATDDLHRSISMLERANQFISGESDAEMLSDRLKICRLWNTVSSTMPTD